MKLYSTSGGELSKKSSRVFFMSCVQSATVVSIMDQHGRTDVQPAHVSAAHAPYAQMSPATQALLFAHGRSLQ